MMRWTAAVYAAWLRVPLLSPSWSAVLAWSPSERRWLAHRIRSIPALAAKVARCPVVPNGRSAAASSASVIVTPVKPSRWRSSPPMIVGDSPAGHLGSSAGYTAQDTITSLTPLAIAAR